MDESRWNSAERLSIATCPKLANLKWTVRELTVAVPSSCQAAYPSIALLRWESRREHLSTLVTPPTLTRIEKKL